MKVKKKKEKNKPKTEKSFKQILQDENTVELKLRKAENLNRFKEETQTTNKKLIGRLTTNLLIKGSFARRLK